METTGRISSIETFGLVDGPGVRFVAFMQGCKMRCKYCHNPETFNLTGGEEYTTSRLLSKALRYRPYWKDNGGITVSGGEPLLQIKFVTEFFEEAKKNNIHTALDTSCQPFNMSTEFLSDFDRLINVCDLVILDIKAMESTLHRELTGHGNENILRAAKYLSDKGIPLWIRHVLVPNLTDSEDELIKIRNFANELKTVERVEILPYHTMGISKWESLGLNYPLLAVPVPTDEEIQKAERIINGE